MMTSCQAADIQKSNRSPLMAPRILQQVKLIERFQGFNAHGNEICDVDFVSSRRTRCALLFSYVLVYFYITAYRILSRSQYPRGLRYELSSLARTLGLWIRIPLRAWMFGVCMRLFYVCVVLCLARGLATG
jgi:hypothetical protein